MIYDTLNRPLQALRISVIDACNYRCTYCMPVADYPEGYQFLKQLQLLSFAEIERLVRLFAQLGVSRLRLTGGEPLLRRDLAQLIRRLKAIDNIEDISLTTNGAHLAQHATSLREAGLNRLTVSVDTLDEEIFAAMSGNRGDLRQVLAGIDIATSQGFQPIKINVVVQRGVNDGGLLKLVTYFKERGHIVRFIEYMDVGNRNGWRREQVVPSREIRELIHSHYPLEPAEPEYFGEVATRYHFCDGSGEIGFISSVTQPFCRSCIRARVSADGKFFTCLFASQGMDLRQLLRNGSSDDEILDCLSKVWSKRSDRYSEERTSMDEQQRTREKVEMYRIGG